MLHSDNLYPVLHTNTVIILVEKYMWVWTYLIALSVFHCVVKDPGVGWGVGSWTRCSFENFNGTPKRYQSGCGSG